MKVTYVFSKVQAITMRKATTLQNRAKLTMVRKQSLEAKGMP